MTEHTHDELRRLFELAIAVRGEDRDALLERECRSDPVLRQRVEALLAAAEGDRFLSMPTSDMAPSPSAVATLGQPVATVVNKSHEAPGGRIGPYKLLQELGEGGFGSVWMAEQEKPVSRKVALKIIKLGMDTKAVVARFEQERQALAILDHPNIAKVFDAGATETGRPYFAMELCTGDPIDQYCDRHNLSIRQRLELFAQVCAAVQHAHSKGLIHRDIKPSNILVSTQDGKPHAKVIDFGIAKATASKLTEKTLFTEHKQLIGTPEYMSPEQAEGSLDIDTRTDVYSLGVLLYELLTGSTPFSSRELRSVAYAEIQRIIREVEPPRPSTRLSQNAETIASVAARRQIEPRKLGTIVRGELDWIVMKALEKDRARRYDTASSLALDIQRYLEGQAISAAPPSTAYRVRTFVRRHKGGVTATALVALALVLGIIGTTFGLIRANEERRAAIVARESEFKQKTLAEDRLKEAEATVKFLDDMLAAPDPGAQGKDVTVRSVLDRASRNLQSQYTDRPLVAARLHGTLGKTYFGLGEWNPAENHARETLALYRRELGPEHRSTREALNSLASVLIKKAALSEVEPMLVEALKDNERLFGRKHEVTAATIDNLAQLYTMMERRAEAIALAKELLDIRTASLGAERIETISVMNTLAILYADTEQFDECEKLYQEAISICQRVHGPDHPLTLEMRGNLGWSLYHDAMAHQESNPDRHANRLARARVMDEEVLAARTRILGEDHPETGNARNNLATVYRELKMWDQADTLTLKDLEVSVRTLGETHPDTIVVLANMGGSLRGRQRFEEAIVYLDRALRGARVSHPKDFQGTAFILGWYGSSLRGLKRFAEGEPMLLEARGIIARTLGEDHDIARRMALDLERLYTDWDKAEPGKGYDAKAAEWKARQNAK
ncbi:MAG: serine/threonine protein kinase [Phycisphaeraceae bacterium]|nr:serine/threonine protein kinase [Phycisphaeraceae bacterium]